MTTTLDPEALRSVQLLAEKLKASHLAHHALMTVARQPAVRELIPDRLPGIERVPTGRLGSVEYHLTWYLDIALEEETEGVFERAWLTGALIALGDALGDHGYFGHPPEFELIRHLRNAAAHGNRFDIRHPEELERRPAYMRRGNVDLTITADLNGMPLMPDTLDEYGVYTVVEGVELKLAATLAAL